MYRGWRYWTAGLSPHGSFMKFSEPLMQACIKTRDIASLIDLGTSHLNTTQLRLHISTNWDMASRFVLRQVRLLLTSIDYRLTFLQRLAPAAATAFVAGLTLFPKTALHAEAPEGSEVRLAAFWISKKICADSPQSRKSPFTMTTMLNPPPRQHPPAKQRSPPNRRNLQTVWPSRSERLVSSCTVTFLPRKTRSTR
jgi:hypothetical protein